MTSGINTLSKGLLGLTMKSKLIYAERGFTLNPGAAGTVSTHVFSAIGLFDPDITGIGHQPTGFDQIMTFYDHYTVIASKIYVRYQNNDSTNHQFCGIFLKDTAVTETDYRVIVENGLGTYTHLAANFSDQGVAELQYGCSTAKFMGRPNLLSEDDLRGSATSNPVDQAYFHVWAAPTTSVDSLTVVCSVRIEYVAVFTEPRTAPIS